MAAYNRRWYILASIIAGLGIGLIGASLGTEELIEMAFTDIGMGSYCKNTRSIIGIELFHTQR